MTDELTDSYDVAMTSEERVDAVSDDGTEIAVWVDGDGPAIVMVHGSMQDHSANRSFVEALRDRVATWSMDRRGFGASAERDPWALEREFEDVAAVVHAAADHDGGAVALWGHSFGAACAMGGARLSDELSHLVLYEPSLGLQYPDGSIDSVEAALAAGDNDRVITEVLTRVLELSDADVEALRATPSWPARVATAPTVPRECRAEEAWVWVPGQFDAISARTLMLTGSESTPDVRAATDAAATAIGDPRIRVLPGHGHFAHRTDPDLVAGIVTDFILS